MRWEVRRESTDGESDRATEQQSNEIDKIHSGLSFKVVQETQETPG